MLEKIKSCNNLKLFIILLLVIFTDIIYKEDLSCIVNIENYIIIYGFIIAVFLFIYDPRVKVDYNTNFTKNKIVEIIVTFIFILYILKVIFIAMFELLKVLLCY